MYSDTSLNDSLEAMKQNVLGGSKVATVEDVNFDSWQDTLTTLFPLTFNKGFSEAQSKYWEWVWSIKSDTRPRPYVLILPRGGGKTTSCEITPILLGAKKVRTYCWYIQETQTQSDKRIANIAEKLESIYIANHYPLMSERWVGKFGNVGGWRRSFVRTASNIVFEAIGLDKAVRSSKVGDTRPDLIIIDDVDSLYDTVRATKKKLDVLTHTLLPAADNNAVIIFVQNLVHLNSIASRLAKTDNTEFLQDRIISGPYPALDKFHSMKLWDEESGRNKDTIVQGIPLWKGQNIEDCQGYINTFGLTSFKTECQQDVENVGNSLWADVEFQHILIEDVPEIEIGCVWCDPAITETDESDCYAIQADGLGIDEKIYRFMSFEERSSPLSTVKTMIIWAVELKFSYCGIETDQGGDTWEVVYDTAWRELCEDEDQPSITSSVGLNGIDRNKPIFRQAKAGAGFGSKAHRNNLMLASYETGKVVHVIVPDNYHEILENSLLRFLKIKPYDLGDAAFWGWDFLSNKRYLEDDMREATAR